jgi:hypothetical protein
MIIHRWGKDIIAHIILYIYCGESFYIKPETIPYRYPPTDVSWKKHW